MKKLLVCLCAVVLAALVAGAQNDKNKSKPKPDLNGSWVIDKSKSSFGRFSQSVLAKGEQTMTIVLKEPEFQVTRDLKAEGQEDKHGTWVYYTDGRGETNPAFPSGGEAKSKTKWDGSKLVSKSSVTRQVKGNDIKMDIEEKWELSKDGKSLIDTITFSTPQAANEVKLVFNRAP